jgi:hypothetical protein
MTDHSLIALLIMVSSVLQMAGLLMLGVIMRQSHRESLQLIKSVGVLVYQETGKRAGCTPTESTR